MIYLFYNRPLKMNTDVERGEYSSLSEKTSNNQDQEKQHNSNHMRKYLQDIAENEHILFILMGYVGILILFAVLGFALLSKYLIFSVILFSIVAAMSILCIIFCVIFRKSIKIPLKTKGNIVLVFVFIYAILLTVFIKFSKNQTETFTENEDGSVYG